MRYETFVDKVGDKAGITHDAEARQGVAAVLQTLDERLPHAERKLVAAQLDDDLKAHFAPEGEFDSFDLKEFVTRVGVRADLDRKDAWDRTVAVVEVLKEAVSSGVVVEMVKALDQSYGALFTEQGTGPLGPAE